MLDKTQVLNSVASMKPSAHKASQKAAVGYSGTPLWKKLGYKEGDSAYVEGAPVTYLAMLELPAEISVRWVERTNAGIAFVHLFVLSKAKLEETPVVAKDDPS